MTQAEAPKTESTDSELPAELQPTVIVCTFMVKVKVAPVVDEEDQETIAERVSEMMLENFDAMVVAYLDDEDVDATSGWDEGDKELIEESVTFEVVA